MTTAIAGACDIQLDNGSRIWCPPAYMALRAGVPFDVTPMTITRPYWTVGTMCKPHTCGPCLTDEEIEKYVKPNLPPR